MRKLFFLITFVLASCTVAFSQDTKTQYDMKSGYLGIYNSRTNRWVTNPIYNELNRIGSYNGVYYYSAKLNGSWGLLDEKGKTAIDFKFEDINGFQNGFVMVKRNGSWGLADIYNHLIIACEFKGGWMNTSRVCFSPWKGEDRYFEMDELVKIRNTRIRWENEAAEKRKIAEQERVTRERKEKELASFTEYARAYVEPKVNQWQKKGEFEKLSDYQIRVTGPNRTLMIDSLTREAERSFIADHASLHPEKESMKLDIYDSENEVFSIESAKLGTMIVPVPIADGPDFKAHFSALEKRDAEYYISDDKIALASLVFYDKATGKSYTYSNSNALNYNHYIIDPDKYQFELVNVMTAKPVETLTTTSQIIPQKPIVSILLPATDATYTDPNVTIRYQATVYDGSTPTIHIWVNGEEVEAKPNAKVQKKGVSAAWDEVELILPKDKDRLCKVMLSITDGSGFYSENKTISLRYVGEMPKPKLHIFAVGVSEYDSRNLSKLEYAAKDAKDFVATVRSSDLSMYEKLVTPIIFTNEAATKSGIEKGLASLVRDVDQDDVVMLFFSGHGVTDGEDTYFMSVDAEGDEPYTGVDFSLIRKNMTKMIEKKCKVLIFMDACYSGAMYLTKSNLKNITFADSDIIGFYSSTASQTSAEFSKDENGVFTKALISGLKGKAKNKEGEITAYGLGKYISDYVSDKTDGKQSPIVENKVGDFVIYRIKQ